MMTGCANNDCTAYSSNVVTVDGEEYCSTCGPKMELDETDDIPENYWVGDDVGSLQVLFEPYETEYPHFVDEELVREQIFRRAGVYVAEREVRGGTAVQRSDELLQRVAEQLRSVAEHATEEYHVLGAGKNHDDTLLIYIDTTTLDGRDPWLAVPDEWLEGTNFRSGTMMGFRQQWWRHKEDSPRLDAPVIKERVTQ